ncbi:coagulation factor XIII B chain-like isoform X1 [Erythrolamprus reginae]|uniref:coagulation factor XIII B chain-like isoform X1 n=1 Tax=Erythrolamprus reginae TaxID=121349 RepID=UPI00396CBA93
MKNWLLLVAAFILLPGYYSQNVCEEPDDIDFGEIVTTGKAKYLENDQVQYSCYPGYVLEGPEWIQCRGQEWTPQPPKCLAPCHITRQQLATKNLFVFGAQRRTRIIPSNHNLQFQCNEGYVLVAPSVRKCADGHMELPLCISEQGEKCNGPPRIENGDIISLSEKQYRSGSSVEFRCQNYYAMEGQNISFCDNGNWTKVPICLEPCMIPMAELESRKIEVKDGMNTSDNAFVQRGYSIELTCRTGYVLEADTSQSISKIHCDGTPPVIPKCKEIRCNPPGISNGYFRSRRTIYYDGDLIRIRCDSGFILENDNGEKVIECTKNGWSPSPKCIQIQCPTPEVTNGDIEPRQTQYVYNNEIEITCSKRFLFKVIRRKYTSICTANGWDPSLPLQCHEIECSLPQVEFGRIQPSQPLYRNNEEIEITCSRWPFVTRNRKKVSKCTANGWDPPVSC